MCKIYKKIAILIIVLCTAWSSTSFCAENSDMYGSKKKSDFENATFAVSVGTVEDEIIKKVYPNAKIQYYNTVTDSVTSINTGKTDATTAADSIFNELHRADKNVKKLPEVVYRYQQGFMLSEKICIQDKGIIQKQLNDFIKESKADGFLDGLKEKWCNGDTVNINYEHKVVTSPKKILYVGMIIDPPYIYYKNGVSEGLDIEFIETFCKKYNYGLETELTDLSSVLLGVTSSKYDMGFGGITITDERKENITFSDCYFTDDVHIIYYEKKDEKIGFFDFLKKEFDESFLQEERYKLILKGICNTLIITLFSIFFGVILGFVLYIIYRKNVKMVNKIIKLYAYVVNGTPFLVFLLVLYYIVFSKVSVSGVVICIVAFVIVFSLFIFESLDSYIKVIDKGQVEAAYALGYTDNETFVKVLLPQAVINIYGSFQSEVVSLLKDTSIVGYIAVEDLTRVGDIIRSRTYKAIFPVISIAIIYFILGSIFKLILRMIGTYINPRKKNKQKVMKKWGGIK